MNPYDSRLDIKLKFNWYYNYDSGDVLGVNSIEVIKGNESIYNMNLKSILQLEAFFDSELDTMARNDISLVDINMDSYLDFRITWTCGKGCYDAYWVYNIDKEIFELNEELNYIRPYFYDCTNRIIYSYNGGTASTMYYEAYKIDDNNEMKFYQSLTSESFETYHENSYYNSEKKLIKIQEVEE